MEVEYFNELSKKMSMSKWLDITSISDENIDIASELGLILSRDSIYSMDKNKIRVMYKISGTIDKLNKFKERTGCQC